MFYYKLSLEKKTDNEDEYEKSLEDSLLNHFKLVNLVKVYGWNLHKPTNEILEIQCVLQFQNKIKTPRLAGGDFSRPEIIPLYPNQISIRDLKAYFPNLSKEKIIFPCSSSKNWQILKKKIESLSQRRCEKPDKLNKREKQGVGTREWRETETAEAERETPTKKLRTTVESKITSPLSIQITYIL